MRLKQKLKSYFKTKESSESAVELLRMFILPFMKLWNPRASIDDAIAAFFAMDERRIFHAHAKKNFKMPGLFLIAGNRPIKRSGARDVTKGQYMLIVIDRKDQNVKVDIDLIGKPHTFLLARPEMEFLKDYIEVREC